VKERRERPPPSEIERAVEEMVREFADRLDIGPEKARRILHKCVSEMRKAGITFEQAIEALDEDSKNSN
jgi:hypothetical protein